jgi:polar amino acid transport system permease protein
MAAIGQTSSDVEAAPVERVKPRRPFSIRQWISAVVILLFAAWVVNLFATNANMRWDVVRNYLFDPQVTEGVKGTIELTVLGQAVAVALGIVIALLQQTRNTVNVLFAGFYIWFFRAVPLLVQLLFWFNIGILLPTIGFTLPFTNYGFSANTNDLISGFTAAILGLGLHEAAYMAEIVRAGILSVPQGQMDAALSIGMERGSAMRRIILPQTLRVIIPPTGNQFIGLLKASSLVSAIGGGDLLTRIEYLYGQNFLVIPMLIVATIWYVAMVAVASIIQHFIESGLRSSTAAGPTFSTRVIRNLFSIHPKRA